MGKQVPLKSQINAQNNTILTAMIILSGIYGSLAYVPTFHSLLYTNYGKVLIGKILLFLMMLVFGAFHFLKGKKNGEIKK